MEDQIDQVAVPSAWVAAFASVIGAGHIQENIPCQDACFYKPLDSSWSLAVLADGAGSAAHAEVGSAKAVELVTARLEQVFTNEDWEHSLPDEVTWQTTARSLLLEVYEELAAYAETQGNKAGDYACTLQMALFSPEVILFAHIGDGRAGYSNEAGVWQSIMTPFRGELANETIFITSEAVWAAPDLYLQTRLIQGPAAALAMLTDGCERTCFEVNLYDSEKEMYYDPNRPFAPFLDPNAAALQRLHQEGKTQAEINTLWARFLEAGNERLKNEADDKTLILAVRVG